MKNSELDFAVSRLSECRIPSPMSGAQFVRDEESVLYHSNLAEIESLLATGKRPPTLEMAGPREKIYFDPSKLKCGIVTCGGLCPGLNDVIRAIVMSLFHHYGVRTVFGFRYGYEGLSHRYGHVPLELTPEEERAERYDLLLAREKVNDLRGEREAQQQDLAILTGLADTLDAGIRKADTEITTGKAKQKLDALVKLSSSFK